MVTKQKARDDILRAFEIYNTREMSAIDRWYDGFLAPGCVSTTTPVSATFRQGGRASNSSCVGSME